MTTYETVVAVGVENTGTDMPRESILDKIHQLDDCLTDIVTGVMKISGNESPEEKQSTPGGCVLSVIEINLDVMTSKARAAIKYLQEIDNRIS